VLDADAAGDISQSSAALQVSISAQQDPVHGAATIGANAVLEIGEADSAKVTFAASTRMLKLDQPSTFHSQIFGFAGDGTLAGSDQIDLSGINFSTIHDSYAKGALTVTDGTHSATLNFHGSYVLANFKFADDGNGGTIVYDPPVAHDNIVFGDMPHDVRAIHDALAQQHHAHLL
jgi:hypothetical protein